MIDAHDLTLIKDEKLRKYMTKYLTMMMTISSAFLVKADTEESLKKRDELWDYLRKTSPEMADMVNHCLLGRPMQMKSAAGRKIIIYGYMLILRPAALFIVRLSYMVICFQGGLLVFLRAAFCYFFIQFNKLKYTYPAVYQYIQYESQNNCIYSVENGVLF